MVIGKPWGEGHFNHKFDDKFHHQNCTDDNIHELKGYLKAAREHPWSLGVVGTNDLVPEGFIVGMVMQVPQRKKAGSGNKVALPLQAMYEEYIAATESGSGSANAPQKKHYLGRFVDDDDHYVAIIPCTIIHEGSKRVLGVLCKVARRTMWYYRGMISSTT